jgi:hypothetical protein
MRVARIGSVTASLLFVLGCSEGHSGPSTAPPAGPPSDGTPDSVQQAISAKDGGVVDYHSLVALAVPPQSLASDTTIGIAPIAEPPVGESDGFSPFGQAYRFTPAGTQFSLSKPAQMTMHYDLAALTAKGYDPSTVQLYYFDEQLGRYLNVPSVLDVANATITARVEHFTVYVAFAQTLLAGNHAPTVALQGTLPNPARSGAPILVRATVKDIDVNGAVAGVQLNYRVTGTPTWTTVPMTKDQSINAADSFQAIIPSAFTVGMAIGTSLDYFVQATDNLGAQSPVPAPLPTIPLPHQYKGGSFAATPSTLTITAGFSRLVTYAAKDEAALAYALVPDTTSITVSNNVGTVTSSSSSGVAFTAGKVGTGNLSATAGGDTVAVPVTVSNGALQSITILGPNGMPSTGTLVLTEGRHYSFDAIGNDAYGNTIYVLPQWTFALGSGASGFIDGNGTLYTLDGDNKSGNVSAFSPGFSSVTATVGQISATQWVQVNPRTWNELGTITESGFQTMWPALAVNGSVPYLVYVAYPLDATQKVAIHARHWDGANWVADADVVGQTLVNYGWPRLTICNGVPYVAYAGDSGDGVLRLRVAHLAGNLWIPDGDSLNVQSGADPYGMSIACDGTTPYVAWNEGSNVFVKKFDGASWVGVGGPVQDGGYPGTEPSLIIRSGAPWVAFVESYQVYVRQWTGSAWITVGNTAINSVASPNGNPVLLSGKNGVWASFSNSTTQSIAYYNGTTWSIVAGFADALNYRNPAEPGASAVDGDTIYASYVNNYNPVGYSQPQDAFWVYHNSETYPVSGSYDEVYPMNGAASNNFQRPSEAAVMAMGPSTPYFGYMTADPNGIWQVHVHVYK